MNKQIKVGSDFSGVGAFNQALIRLDINYEEIFACDMDKYARKTFIHNYGEPHYYPENVYDRLIPKEPLDIFMTSPPCQTFSLAGKRKGEEDKRGVLFYNSHEFIQQNKPRYFIFENVKGLLSDDNGRTFQRWIDYLGGKSVNGTQTMFPDENAVPYHIYFQVLNAKYYGVPQNRERIFIIGIRDDTDNNFNFPKPFELKKRLKDVLEENVDEKYYLSDKMVNGFIGLNTDGVARTIRVGGGSSTDDKHNWDLLKVGYINQDAQASQVFSCHELEVNENGTSNCLTTVQKDNVVIEQRARGYNKGNTFELSPSITSNSWQENNLLREPVIQRIGNYSKSNHNASSIVDNKGISPTVMENHGTVTAVNTLDYRIRKLTPRECFRLMDFPDTFDFSVVSDSQAYKQAGNSICVSVLYEIIKKFKL